MSSDELARRIEYLELRLPPVWRILAQAVLITGLLVGGIASPTAAQEAPPHVGADSPYPDCALTPGAVFDDVTADQVCVPGYASSVRNVTAAERATVLIEYGLDPDTIGLEVDHFIPLELGGSNDISNLWPEPYLPAPAAREKDRVENYLHSQVCSGAMALVDAQAAITADWYVVFVSMPTAEVSPGPTEGHTFYASSFRSADTIYCDTDPGWKSLSPRYLVSFPSLDEALAALPGYHLHRPC